jgi:hypothetical protein
MNIGQTIVEQLQNFLLSEKDANLSPYIFNKSIDNYQIGINVIDFDKFTLLIQRIEFQSTKTQASASLTADQLKGLADNLVKRLTYLMEHFQFVELDATHLKLQLRSRVPEQGENYLAFYEILLDAYGKFTLLRYKHDKNIESRSTVPFHMTKEVFTRLVTDVAEIIRH